jgi:putative sigma-54 modulation protein
MNSVSRFDHAAQLLLRGIHLELDEATKTLLETKAGRLFRHEPRILRVRIDVAREARGRTRVFTARGRVELAGPDLSASVTADLAPVSITLLIDKLDRMLRKRTTHLLRRRTSDDIRAHAALVASA